MAARSRKSRRLSAASSGKLLEHPVLFLDKCLGRNIVATGLRHAGATVEVFVDHFDQTTPDEEWLPEVGKRQWIVLTKDRHIRTNGMELAAVLKSAVPVFTLTAADMTGPEMATAFVAALPVIQHFLAKFSPPYVAAVNRSGKVSMLLTCAELIKRIQ